MGFYPCASGVHWGAQCGTQGSCIAAGSDGQGCDDISGGCSDCYRGLIDESKGPGPILNFTETDPTRLTGFGGFMLVHLTQPLLDAGLLQGDMVMKINNYSVEHPADAIKYLEEPGKKVIKYFRLYGVKGGETFVTTVGT